jgi:predicted metal-dependent hydrolase
MSSASLETRAVALNGVVLEYRLRRSARRTLGITVEPDGTVLVSAPASAAVGQIEAILRKRSAWIRRRREDAGLLPPAPPQREWVSGETHRYLGRQYRLKVNRGNRGGIKLAGSFFQVTVRDPDNAQQVRRRMERWYLDRARNTFERRLSELIRRTPLLRITEPPLLLVRRMEKRWGSCSAEGRILMNVNAVKLPVTCIDYLLMHELCHLRVPHHGPAFWGLLDACMPDWRRWRRRLEQAEI